MNKRVFLGISLIFILGLSACTFSVDTSRSTVGTISVDGTGVVKITPDIAYINIGVQSKSEDVKDALDKNNQLASAISATLQNLGIAPEDVQTSSFNVYPMQDYGPMGMGDANGLPITNYQVDNIILVTVRDLSNLGQILDNAVQSGANTINSISFDVQNKEEALAQARDQAINNAHAQAEATANVAGAKLGNIISISTYNNNNTPYFDGKGGSMAAIGSDVPVSAGQLSLSVTANITYELK